MLQSCHLHRCLLSPQICILGKNFRTTDPTVPTEPHLLAELLFHILFCLQQMWEIASTTGTANLHLQGIKIAAWTTVLPEPLVRTTLTVRKQHKSTKIWCWAPRTSPLPLPKYSTQQCCVWGCDKRRKRITCALLPSCLSQVLILRNIWRKKCLMWLSHNRSKKAQVIHNYQVDNLNALLQGPGVWPRWFSACFWTDACSHFAWKVSEFPVY